MNIHKVAPTGLDRKHIKRLGKPIVPENKAESLNNLIVNKPWGYEYLMFNCPAAEVWSLFIRHNASTSKHCHPNKKTALVVLDGEAEFSTLRESFILHPTDSVIIEKGVFHKTRALSDHGIRVIEIETPPAKYDLLRLQDEYGRERLSYEGFDKMSLEEGECVRFLDLGTSSMQEKNFHNACDISLKILRGSYRQDDLFHFSKSDLIAVVSGTVHNGSKQKYEVADIIRGSDFMEEIGNHRPENASLMLIHRLKKLY